MSTMFAHILLFKKQDLLYTGLMQHTNNKAAKGCKSKTYINNRKNIVPCPFKKKGFHTEVQNAYSFFECCSKVFFGYRFQTHIHVLYQPNMPMQNKANFDSCKMTIFG